MSLDKRSAFQQQVVEALLDSKASDLAAVGLTISKFGERRAGSGIEPNQALHPTLAALSYPNLGENRHGYRQ